MAAAPRPADLIADAILRWRATGEGVLAVGVSGAQGSGKSTVCAQTAALLQARGLRCATLALDDLYLPKADRRRLARDVHPLLATRGPPGTHDVALGLAILRSLRSGRAGTIPRFDKLADDRDPQAAWRPQGGPVDVILFEGWCVGAAPQPQAALHDPINALEREEDRGGAWRALVNTALAQPYRTLFAELDRLVMLAAPGFEVVLRWRLQQEAANAAAADPARRAQAMDEAQMARFIQHYERITRWMLSDLPDRADLVIALDADRGVAGVSGRS